MTEVLEKQQERSTELGRISHWIGGQIVAGESGRSGPVYNPARGMQTKEVDFASVDELDRAVQTAKEALQSWRQVSLSRRQDSSSRSASSSQRREDLAALSPRHGRSFRRTRRGAAGARGDRVRCGIPTLLKGDSLSGLDGIDGTRSASRWASSRASALQLPAMVPFGCGTGARLRQHVRAQAVGEDPSRRC